MLGDVLFVKPNHSESKSRQQWNQYESSPEVLVYYYASY